MAVTLAKQSNEDWWMNNPSCDIKSAARFLSTAEPGAIQRHSVWVTDHFSVWILGMDLNALKICHESLQTWRAAWHYHICRRPRKDNKWNHCLTQLSELLRSALYNSADNSMLSTLLSHNSLSKKNKILFIHTGLLFILLIYFLWLHWGVSWCFILSFILRSENVLKTKQRIGLHSMN